MTEYKSRETFLQKLEVVRELSRYDMERYAIVKEAETGQHYLHYSFIQLNLYEGGNREEYDFFLPLEADDVLGILLGDQPYHYPEHWTKVYWRSGRDDRLIRFDPTGELDEQEGMALIQSLLRFKEAYQTAEDKEEVTRKFFSELEENEKRNRRES